VPFNFDSTINGAFDPHDRSALDTTFTGAVGAAAGGAALASLDVTALQININGGAIATDGNQDYYDAVLVKHNVEQRVGGPDHDAQRWRQHHVPRRGGQLGRLGPDGGRRRHRRVRRRVWAATARPASGR